MKIIFLLVPRQVPIQVSRQIREEARASSEETTPGRIHTGHRTALKIGKISYKSLFDHNVFLKFLAC